MKEKIRGYLFRLSERARIRKRSIHTLKDYTRATVEWILEAQRATPDDGVAHSYSILESKWKPSYPETTGYIICSLLRAANLGVYDRGVLRDAAARMGNWLTRVQLPGGAFPGGHVGYKDPKPAVFNTGQILKGLTDLIREGLDVAGGFSKAAHRAAQWLIDVQDSDGGWRRNLSDLTSGDEFLYNVRTAWALGRYGRFIENEHAITSATKNAERVVSLQEANGWFPWMGSIRGEHPLLHMVSYTINGLCEIGALLNREEFILSALKAAEKLRTLQDPSTGTLPGQLATGFIPSVRWTNTTANAQVAIIWFRLAELTSENGWRQAASRINDFNRTIQDLDMGSNNPGRRGGLRGSIPGNRGYGACLYMNWTQKFHLDALLAELGVSIV